MTDKSPIPADTPRSQPRAMPGRVGIGINVVAQVLLGLAIFAGINYLSYRHYARWDTSPSGDYTLNSSTLNYLRRLSKEVEITVIFTRDSKVYGDMQSLVDEYRRNGKNLIKVEFVDPVRDLERTEQLKVENKLSLQQNGVLVKAKKGMRFIKEEELIIRTQGMDKDHPTVYFRGEDAITSAIIGLMEGSVRRFYFVSGKGARAEASSGDVIEALRELGRQQNFEVLPLNLAEVQTIPHDANGVLVVGPKYDLSDREFVIIRDYWAGKRSALLFMLDPSSDTPRLMSFLKTVGVAPRNDRVLFAESTSAGPRKEFSVQATFSKEVAITKPLGDATTTLVGQSQSLALAINDEGLKQQGVALAPLIIAAPRYWGETSYLDDLPVANAEDTKPPVCLAAAVERGAVADERLRVDSARLVVVGNAAMLDQQTRLAVNQDFLACSLNWIINRDRLVGIPAKRKQQYRVQLTPRQHDLLFWMTAFCAPGIVLLFGFSVWSSRRAS